MAIGRDGSLQGKDRSWPEAHVCQAQVFADESGVENDCFIATTPDVLGLSDRDTLFPGWSRAGSELGLIEVSIPSAGPACKARGDEFVRSNPSVDRRWRGHGEIAMPYRAKARGAPHGDPEDAVGRGTARAYVSARGKRLAARQVGCACLPRPIRAKWAGRSVDEESTAAVVAQERLHPDTFRSQGGRRV